jgi:hypothetical protein
MVRRIAQDFPWFPNVKPEIAAIQLMTVLDPGWLKFSMNSLSLAYYLQKKRMHFHRIPKHASVLPPARIEYVHPPILKMSSDWTIKGPASFILSQGLEDHDIGFFLRLLSPFGSHHRLESLRKGWLKSHSWQPSLSSWTVKINSYVRDDVNITVLGHNTRIYAIRAAAQRCYFSGGFWDTLVTMTPEHFGSKNQFADVLHALRSHDVTEVESISGLCASRRIVVIRNVGSTVIGTISKIEQNGTGLYPIEQLELG